MTNGRIDGRKHYGRPDEKVEPQGRRRKRQQLRAKDSRGQVVVDRNHPCGHYLRHSRRVSMAGDFHEFTWDVLGLVFRIESKGRTETKTYDG